MTELEFITTNPRSYGAGNANLLVSSSVSGSNDIPIPPYTIQGLTIPFSSLEGVNVLSPLKEVEAIRFQFSPGDITAQVIGRQKKDGYFYLKTEPIVINEIPSANVANEYVFKGAEFIFKPYFEINFFNNDYNPLQNNTNESKVNVVRQVVDRVSSQATPTNLNAILSQSAEPAQIQNCSYTKSSIILGRYEGTKETDNNIPGNLPAQGLVRFKSEIYPIDSDVTTIKQTQLSDREVVVSLFDSQISGSHPNKAYQSFPAIGNYVYSPGEIGNSFTKVANSKIYSIDKNRVYSTDEFGQVIQIQ